MPSFQSRAVSMVWIALPFYKWRAKYGGMDSSIIARLKELEAKTAQLKKMYAEERIKAKILKEVIEKKW